MSFSIHAIVAMTKAGVIGKRNALPWKLKDDLPRFKRITTGNTVIMGKNTYDSIGKALPNRHNIVLSHERHHLPGCDVCTSLEEALQKADEYGKDVFIIGGAHVYEQTLPFVDVLHVSHVKEEYEGDVYFPDIDWQEWQETDKEEYDDFIAKTYVRKNRPRSF